MISIAIGILVLLLLIAAGAGAFTRFRDDSGSRVEGQSGGGPTVPWDTERIFVYALAFAGLIAALYAVTGLLATLVVTLTQQSSALASSSDVRDRTSYYLASLVVGTPIWLGLWRLAQRRLSRSREEQRSRERRLFLAAVFAVTSVVALFALHTLLRVILTLPGETDTTPTVRDGIFAAVRLLVWGAAWLYYARLNRQERSPSDMDEPHDLAVYALTGFSLAFLVIGLNDAIRQLVDNLTTTAQSTLLSGNESPWTTWGSIAAWLVSGALVWTTIWQYDLLRGGSRFFRVLYLYLVLAVAVPATLAGGIDTLYELLRRIFGYSESGTTWLFLHDALPPLLIGGGIWAYHWTVMRRQAALRGRGTGAIPWPRRPAIAALTLLSLATAASAFTSLLWLGLDFLLNTGGSASSGAWWRDGLSLGISAGLIAGGTWLAAWTILQRAARLDPMAERTATERRRLLGATVLIATLTAIGFAVALLWTIFRAALGGGFDAGTYSQALKDLSTVIVALAIAAYHGLILREDRKLRVTRPKALRVLALVAPGAEESLAQLGRLSGPRIEVVGYLSHNDIEAASDLTTLNDQLAALEQQGSADGALLMLGPDGGHLYPYTKRIPQPAPSLPEPDRPARLATGESEAAPL